LLPRRVCSGRQSPAILRAAPLGWRAGRLLPNVTFSFIVRCCRCAHYLGPRACWL